MTTSLKEKIYERRLRAGIKVPTGELPAARPVPVNHTTKARFDPDAKETKKSLKEKIHERQLRAGIKVPTGELPAARPVPVDHTTTSQIETDAVILSATKIETIPEIRRTAKVVDEILLRTLARVKFATREQLTYWCGVPSITVFRRLTYLKNTRLIDSANQGRRYATIWSMKQRGKSIMLARGRGGRYISWSVMAHACHRNSIEILLGSKQESRGFRFLDNVTLFKHGLFPARGEHCGQDRAERAYLVLLDDYMMKPERIGHAWERPHHPPRKYFSGNRSLSWSKIVNQYIVVTTDELRAEKHAVWIERHSIPARVITIKPLWN